MMPEKTHKQVIRILRDLRTQLSAMREDLKDINAQLSVMRERVEILEGSNAKKIKMVTDIVEKAYGLQPGIVYTRCRVGRTPEARYICITIIGKTSKMTLQKLSDIFGIHHSTVLYAMQIISDRYKLYGGFRTKFDEICAELGIVVKL